MSNGIYGLQLFFSFLCGCVWLDDKEREINMQHSSSIASQLDERQAVPCLMVFIIASAISLTSIFSVQMYGSKHAD
ncbi:hypothetical protein PAEN110709_14915 [Paenibacillus endophyticus]